MAMFLKVVAIIIVACIILSLWGTLCIYYGKGLGIALVHIAYPNEVDALIEFMDDPELLKKYGHSSENKNDKYIIKFIFNVAKSKIKYNKK